MSVVRTHPADRQDERVDDHAASEPPSSPPDGARAHTSDESADGSGEAVATLTSKPPPMPAGDLNRRKITTSNTKQQRAKEAEEDRALIARAQAGDKVAFRQLVERHQRRAFAIALALVRDENDARELVQDAFLRVFKGLGTFQGGSSFFTWLYRIITNLSIDLIRKPGRQLVDIDEGRFESDESTEAEFPLLS